MVEGTLALNWVLSIYFGLALIAFASVILLTIRLFQLGLPLTLCFDECSVPVSTFLYRTTLGGKINVYDAKAFAIAVCPFVIVQEGPDKVASNGNPLSPYLRKNVDMVSQELHTSLI